MDDKKNNQAVIVNLHGSTMMSIHKITRKGDDIAMTGNIMGTMPGTFYITPENLWKTFKMVKPSLVFGMIGLLIKGSQASRKSSKKTSTP